MVGHSFASCFGGLVKVYTERRAISFSLTMTGPPVAISFLFDAFALVFLRSALACHRASDGLVEHQDSACSSATGTISLVQ